MIEIRLVGPAEKPHLYVNGARAEGFCVVAERQRLDHAREICFKMGRHWRRRLQEWAARTDEFMILFAPNPSTLRSEPPAVFYATGKDAFRRELAKVCLIQDRRPCMWAHVLSPEARAVMSLSFFENTVQPAGHA